MSSVLVLVTASLGAPITSFAQSSKIAQLGTISGEVVDAGGQALASQRVELVQTGNIVLQTTTSGSRGEWMLTNVAPGEYTVRTMINGHIAGSRVTVAVGQSMAHALIVAPSAAAPSAAFMAALGILGGTLVGAGLAAVVISTVIYVTKS